MVDIKTIQRYELNILKYIDEVCRTNDICYYLGFGTLIGAIRHKGFIPWDDDIDILMPREDYNRFRDICNKDNNERYRFCDIDTEERWTAPLAKVIDTKTKLNQVGHHEMMNLGLYVDIFVLDGVPNDVHELKKWERRLNYLQKLWSLCEHENRAWVSIFNIGKNILGIVLKRVTSARAISKEIESIAKKYSYNFSDIVGPNTFMVYPRSKTNVPKSFFGRGCDVEFEGEIFKAPEKYDEYLRNIYGDYMKLPPKEEQVTHHVYALEIIEQVKECEL